MNETLTVQSALSLLDYFAVERQNIGLSDFVRMSGMPKATVLRHLKALENYGLIKKEKDTKKYHLSYKILELSYLLKKQLTLKDLILPYMEKLRDLTEETVCLTIEDDGDGINIERIESRNKLVYLPPIGSREALYAGASRRVLLAFLPEENIYRIINTKGLSKITSKTITDQDQLMKEIQLIRKRGYAISEGEHVEGVYAIAAPVINKAGRVLASLSILGPLLRLTEEKKKAYLGYLLDTGNEISNELGNKTFDFI